MPKSRNRKNKRSFIYKNTLEKKIVNQVISEFENHVGSCGTCGIKMDHISTKEVPTCFLEEFENHLPSLELHTGFLRCSSCSSITAIYY